MYRHSLLSFLFLVVLCIDTFAFSQNTKSTVGKINYECTRQCDSHFSGRDCWEKTLKFYSNELFQAIVLYKNAIKYAGLNGSEARDEITKIMNEYIDGMNLNAFNKASPMNVTYELLDRILELNQINSNTYTSECPSVCVNNQSDVWRALYGVFMGLSLATLIFLIFYIAFLKLEYKKYDKKLTSNSISS